MLDWIDQLRARLSACSPSDQERLSRRLFAFERTVRDRRNVPGDAARTITDEVERALRHLERRAANVPKPTYPSDLPVVQRKDEIAAAIRDHRALVLCGETGSGKSTQLPKICLDVGRGVRGMIGHTQPRRIAARSIAARLAQELESSIGHAVGYKVRFTDKTSPDTYVKVMTDGVLLAETQIDRRLLAYDTIIVDEAHERGLNIDFLLGYLRQLMQKRDDLKIIVTSATIDPERFSKHFDNCPIIEVSGRTYPVEIRYRPPQESSLGDDDDAEPEDLPTMIYRAAEELAHEGPGDLLVFLPGEREIREAAEELEKHRLAGVRPEIVPLYARLSVEEQQRIFQPHGKGGRRVVLATNVAETSLTVPGIRYVIDSGLARISRYSPKTRVQGLPIERISQASANQRSGRCGRVGPGICVRLYAQDDFERRPPFMEPEILRDNLASVILQMKALRLGEVESFPFIDRPSPRMIRDGLDTLLELGAIDSAGQLTQEGSRLARLPVDPRIGRIILEGQRQGVLEDVMVIAAALSVQDPRDRPIDKRDQADEMHARFADPESDFLGFLKLWRVYHEQAAHLSRRKLWAWCREHFLSPIRMREWHDVHSQLVSMAGDLGLHKHGDHPRLAGDRARTGGPGDGRDGQRRRPAREEGRAQSEASTTARGEPVGGASEVEAGERVHRAVLSGFLCNVGKLAERDAKAEAREAAAARASGSEPKERGDYDAPHGTKFNLFPGSTLYGKKPKWVVSSELVRTTRVYARSVARVRPDWIEEAGMHVVKRTHLDARWDALSGTVVASERVTLFGLELVSGRPVNLGPIDPVAARKMFIHHALVECNWNCRGPFFSHNRQLVEQVREDEAKQRRRDLLAEADQRFAFYDARLPATVWSGKTFEEWRRQAEAKNPRLLFMSRADVVQPNATSVDAQAYPEQVLAGPSALKVEYKFDPGAEDDGLNASVPLAALRSVEHGPTEWLVPGMLREKVIELIRGLPQTHRKLLGPAPSLAEEFLRANLDRSRPLTEALAEFVARSTGHAIPLEVWARAELPPHLRMRFVVTDEAKRLVGAGRDLPVLKRELGRKADAAVARLKLEGQTKSGLTDWTIGALEQSIRTSAEGLQVLAFPALVDEGRTAGVRLAAAPTTAHAMHAPGLRRLLWAHNRREIQAALRATRLMERLIVLHAPLGKGDELEDQLGLLTAERAMLLSPAAAPSATSSSRAPKQGAGSRTTPSVAPSTPELLALAAKVRDASSFRACELAGAPRISSAAAEVAALASTCLETFYRIRLRSEKLRSPAFAFAAADIEAQLVGLLSHRFLARIPWPHLVHLPRYLGAIELRLDRLTAAKLEHDRRSATELGPWVERYSKLVLARAGKEQAPGWPMLEPDDAKTTYRWMIEEYRVSLFAQELGTALPVSPKRMEEQWARVEMEEGDVSK
ncbi:MAG: ATP-dependent RNA helicase HrpA [Planctomycetota bacterium]|nr:ATP-dependent RNA helicase HrpA [Planctomycetota bacterium]